jgi:hypothetical protein
MLRTQEELELALLQYLLEFNETRFASPGVVVYDITKRQRPAFFSKPFQSPELHSSPAGASSFFSSTGKPSRRSQRGRISLRQAEILALAQSVPG